MKIDGFLASAWKHLPHTFARKVSRDRWKPYPYLKYISERLATGIAKGNARFIVEVPPRHGKSELISVFFPTWFLEAEPAKNVILASYESDFASHWGRRVRNLIVESEDLIDLRLSPDSTAANRFHTTQGGGMVTAGVGGPITGRGGHLMLIDDPIKNHADAMSSTKRESLKEWFKSTFYTRTEPGGSIILLQTRWHEDDLAGWLQSEQDVDWNVIKLPALAFANDPLGRAEGEPLCPERYDREKLLGFRSAIGSKWFNSLYQQSPLPDEGVKFKKEWLRFYKRSDLPQTWEMIFMSWDLTFEGEDESDWNVGQVWGISGSQLYFLEQVREKATFIRQCQLIEAQIKRWPHYVALLIEKKANGAAVIDFIKPRVHGIIEVKPVESKEVRADFVTPFWEAGNVVLPHPDESPWVEAFIDEVLKFPSSRNKDQVDAMTQALRWNSERKMPSLRLL
jgi:predicted phage terminase large subunit-like protein